MRLLLTASITTRKHTFRVDGHRLRCVLAPLSGLVQLLCLDGQHWAEGTRVTSLIQRTSVAVFAGLRGGAFPQVADRALAAFLAIQAALRRSAKLGQFSYHPGLLKRFKVDRFEVSSFHLFGNFFNGSFPLILFSSS